MNLIKEYISKFEKLDGEKYKDFFDKSQDILSFLEQNLPVFVCSDKTIEEIYYFRAYTFAKHIKHNRDGKFIITEWLDYGGWQKETDGAISCAVGHHLSELKWFRNGKEIAEDYIRFWCKNQDYLAFYNNWFVYAVWDYCETTSNMDFAVSILDSLIEYFERQRSEHKADCGLYKSVDNYDGMELSISGHGIRPTINSYIYGNAYGLYKILEYAKDVERATEYRLFAEILRDKINAFLFKGDFYYNQPLEIGEEMPRHIPKFCNPNQDYDIKELCGYVPWYFGVPTQKESVAWKYVTDKNVFLAPYGLTTADKSHKQFAFEFLHECLWNGPVWPYATSQTLTGMIRALQDDKLKNLPITAREYCLLLKIYATSQYIAIDNNEKRPWIDENLDGETGEWLARKWLYERDRQDKDRGKDYNHSTFIDLVIGGLCGAKGYNGVATFTPINDTTEISYFSLKGISICGELYNIFSDEKGFKVEKIS